MKLTKLLWYQWSHVKMHRWWGHLLPCQKNLHIISNFPSRKGEITTRTLHQCWSLMVWMTWPPTSSQGGGGGTDRHGAWSGGTRRWCTSGTTSWLPTSVHSWTSRSGTPAITLTTTWSWSAYAASTSKKKYLPGDSAALPIKSTSNSLWCKGRCPLQIFVLVNNVRSSKDLPM